MAAEKTASALSAIGSVAKGVGRVGNHVWQKSMEHNGPVMGTIGVGLGATGAAALAKHVIGRTRAAYQGFQPEVQQYTQQTPY